jgi:hypothetical protein
MKVWLIPAWLAILVLAASVLAQDEPPSKLSELALGAVDRFTPPTAQQISQSRSEARAAAEALDDRLRAAGENGRAWRRYVPLDEIAGELQSKSPDLAALRESVQRLSADHDGLELPWFTRLRVSLWRCIGLLEASDPSAQDEYARRIAELAEALKTLEAAADPRTATNDTLPRIGVHAGWLEQHAQSPQLVQAIRRRYAQPNLLLTVSQRVLDGFEEPFRDDSPFSETILGTPTYGQSEIRGQVRLAFAPCDDGAAIRLNLNAAGTADTVSVSGPVRIYSLGRVRLSASKQLLLTQSGAEILPAEAEAASDSETRGISTTLRGIAHRLACRVAWRQLAANRAAAQAEADRKAERRMQQRFDDSAGEQLQALAERYLAEIRAPLVSRGQFPQRVDLRTTSDRMLLTLVQADFDQLAAATPPPELDGQGDFALRVHESAVNNLAQKLFGGREVSVDGLVARIEGLVSAFGEDTPLMESDDDIQVTLDEQQPLSLTFDDSIAALTIRGTKFVARGRPYPAMNVTIRYRMQQTPDGARFALAEEPEVIPTRLVGVDKGRLSLAELTVRRLLLNRLKEDLEKEVTTRNVELPGDTLDLEPLPIEQLSVDDGWLVFSCRVTKPAAAD